MDTKPILGDNTATKRGIKQPQQQQQQQQTPQIDQQQRLSSEEIEQLVRQSLSIKPSSALSNPVLNTRNSVSTEHSELSFSQEGIHRSFQETKLPPSVNISSSATPFTNQNLATLKQLPNPQQRDNLPHVLLPPSRDQPQQLLVNASINPTDQIVSMSSQQSPQFQSPAGSQLFLSTAQQKESSASQSDNNTSSNISNPFANSLLSNNSSSISNIGFNNQTNISSLNNFLMGALPKNKKNNETEAGVAAISGISASSRSPQRANLVLNTNNNILNMLMNPNNNADSLSNSKPNNNTNYSQILTNPLPKATAGIATPSSSILSPSRVRTLTSQSSGISLAASSNKVRSASPGWSDSTSPAIAGALKVLKEKYNASEMKLKEFEELCQKQQNELAIQQQRLIDLTSQNEAQMNQSNDNIILKEQIKQLNEKNAQLLTETMYLKRCNEILESEKAKHLEHNALDRDALDGRLQVLTKLRDADKNLVEKLERDIEEAMKEKQIIHDKLQQSERNERDLKEQMHGLESRIAHADNKLAIAKQETQAVRNNYEQERNRTAKCNSISAQKELLAQQAQAECADMKKELMNIQGANEQLRKGIEKSERQIKKLARDKTITDETYGQLRLLLDEIIQLISKDGSTRIKEHMHLFQQRIKRIDDKHKINGTSSISNIDHHDQLISSSSTSRGIYPKQQRNISSSSQSAQKSARQSQSKDSMSNKKPTNSRNTNYSNNHSNNQSQLMQSSRSKDRSASKTKLSGSKNHKVIVSSTSSTSTKTNAVMKRSKSKRSVSQDRSQQALHLEDLNESLLSRRSGQKKSNRTTSKSKDKREDTSRDNSLVISENHNYNNNNNSSVDYGCQDDSPSRTSARDRLTNRSQNNNNNIKQQKQLQVQQMQTIESTYQDRGSQQFKGVQSAVNPNTSALANISANPTTVSSAVVPTYSQSYQFPPAFEKQHQQ